MAGSRTAPPGREVVHLDQHRDPAAAETTTVLDAAAGALAGMAYHELRSLLAKFGLGARQVASLLGELSPGEATRLTLAVASARPARLLVLDEPTNHLDLEARDELVGALVRWPGTVLMATHDRDLVVRTGARVLDLEA